MKSARALLHATAILLASFPVAAVDPDGVKSAVRQLPVLGEIRSPGRTPLVLRGRLSLRDRARALEAAREVHDDLYARLTRTLARTPAPAEICLFASQAEYDEFVGATYGSALSPAGFYIPVHRVAVVNLGRGLGNLRHELVHVLIADDYPDIPAWLTEGLGALYGTSWRGPLGYEGLVNYRLRALQNAIRAGALPSLDQLAGSHYEDLHGPRSATFYAMSRYVLLYLQARGRLPAFYAAARRTEASEHARLLRAAIDWEEFLGWTRRLRWPPNQRVGRIGGQ